MNAPLTQEWLEAFSLAERGAPDFFRLGDAIRDLPHAAAMRQALEEIGISAIHCIQGVPTIAFVVLEQEDEARIDRIHADLWNQGLMSLLLVIVGNKLLAYTLTRRPVEPERRVGLTQVSDQRLLDTLNLLEDALKLRDFVSGVESGRLFRDDYPQVLDAADRVDGVLLANLMASHRQLLQAGLDAESSQALLMQVMFIAYLEDRGVLAGDYFQEAAGQADITGLRPLLHARRPDLLRRLFLPLHEHFNGDLFHSPCAFGTEPAACALAPEHLGILEEFIWGEWEMDRKQKRFWTYHFRYIPVELISAVYDRMLAEAPGKKKAEGAFYTPMFLADLVVDQAWEFLDEKQRHAPEILDPACGSGVFLVRLFERVVEHRRAKNGGKLPWHSLIALVRRLHGWDKNPMAVRIAAFSLYLALLEQRDPREIRHLMAEGKMLPTLWGHNLQAADFFAQPGERLFDLVIGNPPWNSRAHKLLETSSWHVDRALPIPQEQSAWGFAWKAREHCQENGLIAFLLPAMGFLHNEKSAPALRIWLSETRIERLIHFGDLSFQLFDGPSSPTALALYRPARTDQSNYRFDYWTPKADFNSQSRRLLTISQIDRTRINLHEALANVDIFKHRLWMGGTEQQLFEYLSSFPRLSSLVALYSDAKNDNQDWVIGQGFSKANSDRIGEPGYVAKECPELRELIFLDATSEFRPWILPKLAKAPLGTAAPLVHRRRFVDGFYAPHILVPQGIIRKEGRIRAALDDQDVCFYHSIQSIKYPHEEADTAKLLTAILNSRLASWFVWQIASALGVEIAKVHEKELLAIPFPAPEDMEDAQKAFAAINNIIAVMDELISRRDRLLDEDHWPETIRRLDELVYAYFGLNEDEITIIQETFDEIIPAIQPNKGKRPKLWNDSTDQDQTRYLRELEASLSKWMQAGTVLYARVLTSSADAAIVHVHLGEPPTENQHEEAWNAALTRIWKRLDRPISRNLQVITDLHLFDGDDLYLFKPRKRRFWLRTTAMNDAAAIAGELLRQPEE